MSFMYFALHALCVLTDLTLAVTLRTEVLKVWPWIPGVSPGHFHVFIISFKYFVIIFLYFIFFMIFLSDLHDTFYSTMVTSFAFLTMLACTLLEQK